MYGTTIVKFGPAIEIRRHQIHLDVVSLSLSVITCALGPSIRIAFVSALFYNWTVDPKLLLFLGSTYIFL